jgi:hypothetical protein
MDPILIGLIVLVVAMAGGLLYVATRPPPAPVQTSSGSPLGGLLSVVLGAIGA